MLWVEAGQNTAARAAWNDWNDLHDFIKYNDMGNQANYEYVKTRLDYKSLVDYILINSFVVCSDWINWNVGWWRGTNPDGGHQKWGYVLWDEDATFAHYINYTGVPGISPYTSPCYPEGLTSDPEQHIVMLNHLLDNDEFYEYYVNRYIDHYNSAFIPDKMIDYLSSIEDRMAPEMPKHVARWGGSVTQWENNVQKIKNFVSNRHSYLPTGLNSCYDLTGPYEINLAVYPPEAGRININSLELDVPVWGGMYFGGINTHLEVLSTNPNFEFSHWEAYNHEFSPSDSLANVTVNFSTGDFITAVFEQIEFLDSLVINEINYNADVDFDTEDWVEFYNPHNYLLDISGWEFKDSDDEHVFQFPDNTVIGPNGYLVLSRDTAIFSSFFPEVSNVIGNMDFGLSSNGELIRLFDSTGVLIDTVHYSNLEPWPTEPDGGGPTLELKAWNYDNALPESWVTSADHGTPGEMNGYIVSNFRPDEKKEFSFVIYPNPMIGSSILQITSGEIINNGSLQIFNIYGKKVLEINSINGNRLTLSKENLSKGIYVCMLYDENNHIIRKTKLMVD
ncbi:MAG: CotH kinase family protein [Bacteroidales bacterium]